MKKEIEKAIRETLVVSNPKSIKYAVNKIVSLFKKDNEYTCPNGCGQNGDLGNCWTCMGKD